MGLLQWILSLIGVTILGVTFDAGDIWLHLDLIFGMVFCVVDFIASGKLRKMEKSSIVWVNVWLGLHVLSVVRNVIVGLIDANVESLGTYLGVVVVIILDWCIFKYYRNRKELFVK